MDAGRGDGEVVAPPGHQFSQLNRTEQSVMQPSNNDPKYTTLEKHCRCTGPRVSPMPDMEHDLGTWCGRNADQEDGLCDRCRRDCGRYGDANVAVITVPQVVQRDTPWLERVSS